MNNANTTFTITETNTVVGLNHSYTVTGTLSEAKRTAKGRKHSHPSSRLSISDDNGLVSRYNLTNKRWLSAARMAEINAN